MIKFRNLQFIFKNIVLLVGIVSITKLLLSYLIEAKITKTNTYSIAFKDDPQLFLVNDTGFLKVNYVKPPIKFSTKIKTHKNHLHELKNLRIKGLKKTQINWNLVRYGEKYFIIGEDVALGIRKNPNEFCDSVCVSHESKLKNLEVEVSKVGDPEFSQEVIFVDNLIEIEDPPSSNDTKKKKNKNGAYPDEDREYSSETSPLKSEHKKNGDGNESDSKISSKDLANFRKISDPVIQAVSQLLCDVIQSKNSSKVRKNRESIRKRNQTPIIYNTDDAPYSTPFFQDAVFNSQGKHRIYFGTKKSQIPSEESPCLLSAKNTCDDPFEENSEFSNVDEPNIRKTENPMKSSSRTGMRDPYFGSIKPINHISMKKIGFEPLTSFPRQNLGIPRLLSPEEMKKLKNYPKRLVSKSLCRIKIIGNTTIVDENGNILRKEKSCDPRANHITKGMTVYHARIEGKRTVEEGLEPQMGHKSKRWVDEIQQKEEQIIKKLNMMNDKDHVAQKRILQDIEPECEIEKPKKFVKRPFEDMKKLCEAKNIEDIKEILEETEDDFPRGKTASNILQNLQKEAKIRKKILNDLKNQNKCGTSDLYVDNDEFNNCDDNGIDDLFKKKEEEKAESEEKKPESKNTSDQGKSTNSNGNMEKNRITLKLDDGVDEPPQESQEKIRIADDLIKKQKLLKSKIEADETELYQNSKKNAANIDKLKNKMSKISRIKLSKSKRPDRKALVERKPTFGGLMKAKDRMIKLGKKVATSVADKFS